MPPDGSRGQAPEATRSPVRTGAAMACAGAADDGFGHARRGGERPKRAYELPSCPLLRRGLDGCDRYDSTGKPVAPHHRLFADRYRTFGSCHVRVSSQ